MKAYSLEPLFWAKIMPRSVVIMPTTVVIMPRSVVIMPTTVVKNGDKPRNGGIWRKPIY